ncbi:MAG: RNA polymerase factor sigma-54 [Phycisphaeraceae bacterium]|nr:RNA polymerase factor sigma-54 [Phycisphaeraceae bacterium]MBX3405263.1 RNA polymerase factor sigma-54 [Phycisphaeraceae bacterium]
MSQQMKLAPRMIQSMEILQMPLQQLEERIAQELESNATLELAEESAEAGESGPAPETGASADSEDRPMRVDEADARDDFARLESFEESNPEAAANSFDEEPQRAEAPRIEELGAYSRARLEGEPDAKSEAMANTASRSASLIEQLQDQWRMADVDEALRPLGEAIISYIDDDGYLRTPFDAILDRWPADRPRPASEDLQRALSAVQLLLEPPGVAARDVRECLLLQVDALAERPGEPAAQWAVVGQLINDHLEDLAQNRLPRIVEKTGLSMDDLKRAMERMHLLSLAPARQLVQEPPSAIVPDAIVEYDADADRYVAYLNDSRMPGLRINREYALLAKDRAAPKPTREFLKKSLSNAAWLIDAVEQRRRTLLRVIQVVVQAQREYFDYGPQALRPLPMTLVAEQLGVHVATVSRAVAEKYLLTPRGIVPLRSFFSGGTQTQSGEEMSWDAIKAALKEIIDAEEKTNPLSDDALAEELKKRGIEIARRTVAKYRDQLGVPSARLRKAY